MAKRSWEDLRDSFSIYYRKRTLKMLRPLITLIGFWTEKKITNPSVAYLKKDIEKDNFAKQSQLEKSMETF